jgi:type VI secretion system secreted protein Hcp
MHESWATKALLAGWPDGCIEVVRAAQQIVTVDRGFFHSTGRRCITGEFNMAETVHLYLKASGSDIQGNSTQVSLGRENSIECVYYEQEVMTAREAGSGMATGRRQYKPLLIRKRIDKSTPLIAKALCNNQEIDATFKFFRPSPTGDGTTEQFFTVEIKKGRIAHQKQFVPDTMVPSTATDPALEEVSFVFHTINWTYTNGGVQHEDTWDAQT